MTHHPSCKPSDQTLGWLCSQCGTFDPTTHSQLAHAANAYPRLVAALRAVVDMRGHHTVYPWMNDENTIEAFKDARALLRELGESE